MPYSETTATRKIVSLNKRIRAVQGGTSASKTVSIILYLIAKAQTDTAPTLTSIVSESFPHLKRGAMRDFLNIMQEHGYFQDSLWNRSDYTYEFETGSRMEFFSADQPGKVRGPRRDRLFVNEANRIPWETFDQLEVRTREFAFLDWNPSVRFWFYDRLEGREDVDHLILTYRDNGALDESIVKAIEAHKGNKSWWKVYGEGLLGEVEGKIYRDWRQLDDVPHEARLERRGIDFGYSVDPAAIVDVYYLNGGYVLDERVCQRGLSNQRLADYLKEMEPCQTFADSVEPKSIDELRSYGLTVMPAEKGPDSVRYGIRWLQDQRISYTKRSVNLRREYETYVWKEDRDGNFTEVPLGEDHCLDAVRYALTGANRPKSVLDAVKEAKHLRETQDLPQIT